MKYRNEHGQFAVDPYREIIIWNIRYEFLEKFNLNYKDVIKHG